MSSLFFSSLTLTKGKETRTKLVILPSQSLTVGHILSVGPPLSRVCAVFYESVSLSISTYKLIS